LFGSGAIVRRCCTAMPEVKNVASCQFCHAMVAFAHMSSKIASFVLHGLPGHFRYTFV
jgi:hypothetical protein